MLSHISLVNESSRSLVIALVNKFAVNNFDLFNSTNRTHEATLCGCEALLKMHRDRERGLSEGKQTLENEVLSSGSLKLQKADSGTVGEKNDY